MKKSISVLFAILAALILFVSACAPSIPTPAATPEPAKTEAVTAAPTAEPTAVPTPTPVPMNPLIRLSTTTSVNDSGLLPVLQKDFEADTGYKLEIISNGTGAAIKLGETGDADVLLVHAKASEEEFIKNGFGVDRIPFMHNFFVIVGPKK